MLPEKVHVTDDLLLHIQNTRKEKDISAENLSRSLPKPDGFISALERKRYKKIASSLLMKIFYSLHEELGDEEIIAKIESLTSIPDVPESASDEEDNTEVPVDDGRETMTFEKKDEYDLDEDYNNPYLIQSQLRMLSAPFNAYYQRRPRDAVYTITAFLTSMRFDLSFMMKIIGFPFFIFKTLSKDERISFIKEFRQLFDKYLAIAEPRLKPDETFSPNSEVYPASLDRPHIKT